MILMEPTVTTMIRLVSILAFAASAALVSHPAAAQGGPGGPPAVGVVTVKKQAITEVNTFVGRIQSVDRVDLVARVTAFLDKRLFAEGTEVSAGDVLYQLEKPPYEADLAGQDRRRRAGQRGAAERHHHAGPRAPPCSARPPGQRSTVDDASATQQSQAAQLACAQAQLRHRADQPQLHRHQGADRRQDLAHRDHRRQRRRADHRHAGHHRQPGPDVRELPHRAASAAIDLRDRYAAKGGSQAVVIKLQAADRRHLRTGRPHRLRRPHRRHQHRHADRAGHDRQPGAARHAVRRRVATASWRTASSSPCCCRASPPCRRWRSRRRALLSDQQGSYVWVIGDGQQGGCSAGSPWGRPSGVLATIVSGLQEGEMVVVDGSARRPTRPPARQPGAGGRQPPGPAAAPRWPTPSPPGTPAAPAAAQSPR